MKRQLVQDKNALLLGNAYLRERAISKTNVNYNNSAWDLVDAYTNDTSMLRQVNDSLLPACLKPLSRQQRISYIEKEIGKREVYREGILSYGEKAETLLRDQNLDASGIHVLATVIKKMILKEGKKNGFSFKE